MTPNTTTQTTWDETRDLIVKGLTHEINNVIAATYSLSEFHYSNAPSDTPLHKAMGNIKSNATECYNLLQQLTNLFKNEPKEPQYINLEHTLQDLCPLIKTIIPSPVSINTQFTKQEIPIYSSITNLNQNILNLITEISPSLNQPSVFTIKTKILSQHECSLIFIFSSNTQLTLPPLSSVSLKEIAENLYQLSMDFPIANLLES